MKVLKPCPHCGEEAYYMGAFAAKQEAPMIICQNGHMFASSNARTEEDLVYEWSKRPGYDKALVAMNRAMGKRAKADAENRELRELVSDWCELYENPDYGECVRLRERMEELGIEVGADD